MSIPVECPNCGVRFDAPDATAGNTYPCPRCHNPLTVPADGGTPVRQPVGGAPVVRDNPELDEAFGLTPADRTALDRLGTSAARAGVTGGSAPQPAPTPGTSAATPMSGPGLTDDQQRANAGLPPVVAGQRRQQLGLPAGVQMPRVRGVQDTPGGGAAGSGRATGMGDAASRLAAAADRLIQAADRLSGAGRATSQPPGSPGQGVPGGQGDGGILQQLLGGNLSGVGRVLGSFFGAKAGGLFGFGLGGRIGEAVGRRLGDQLSEPPERPLGPRDALRGGGDTLVRQAAGQAAGRYGPAVAGMAGGGAAGAGGLAALAGPAAIAVGLAVALKKLYDAVEEGARRQRDHNFQFAEQSAQMAAVQARSETQDFFRKQSIGDRTAESAARLDERLQKLDDRLAEIEVLGTRLLNEGFSNALDVINGALIPLEIMARAANRWMGRKEDEGMNQDAGAQTFGDWLDKVKREHDEARRRNDEFFGMRDGGRYTGPPR